MEAKEEITEHTLSKILMLTLVFALIAMLTAVVGYAQTD